MPVKTGFVFMNIPKIVVVVSGGVVQAAFSSDEDIDFTVLDFDNMKEDGLDCDKVLLTETESLQVIY